MSRPDAARWVGAGGVLLLILALLSTFDSRRGGGVFDAFANRGLGKGTPFHTTWNVLFLLAGAALLVAAAALRRRDRRA
ncbi:MAG TPA: hypothetical protein VHH36_07730 [Candidatus Thermoplasmatota archaeon]|nr:hypothetical protein [Candidatus Thermoplasmatota archaeon]